MFSHFDHYNPAQRSRDCKRSLIDSSPPIKALFLDRDGVVNVDAGYISLPKNIIFVDGIFEQCKSFNDSGYQIFIITNQSGIGRGLYTENDFHKLMRWMIERFEEKGCKISGYYFCPHLPDDECECRKPKPGMLLQAAKDYNINLAESVFIGDKDTDFMAAQVAGIKKTMKGSLCMKCKT